MQTVTDFERMTAQELLSWAVSTYGDRFAISTSFQREGMVLIDMAAKISPEIRVFTLDTGRLPDETYQIVETVRGRYGIQVELILPDAAEVESMVRQHGPNLFYRDVPNRMLCCQVRKVRPLERKLATLQAWTAGLRRGQNESRAAIPKLDESASPVKLCPLADWSAEDVTNYIALHNVPEHPLYAAGYTSIGCAPCTRPLQPGESERAGRWWWENGIDKECGIHFTPDGRARRKVDIMLDQIITGAGDGI